MLIEITTKNSNGSVLFNGSLTQDELNFILNVGVNAMLNAGHLPFKKLDTHTLITIPSTSLLQ